MRYFFCRQTEKGRDVLTDKRVSAFTAPSGGHKGPRQTDHNIRSQEERKHTGHWPGQTQGRRRRPTNTDRHRGRVSPDQTRLNKSDKQRHALYQCNLRSPLRISVFVFLSDLDTDLLELMADHHSGPTWATLLQTHLKAISSVCGGQLNLPIVKLSFTNSY